MQFLKYLFLSWLIVATSATVMKEDFKPLQLQEMLLTNYSKYVKPRLNPSHAVELTFNLTYSSLVKVDNLEQEVTSLLFLTVAWEDELLRWEPSSYDNISTIYLDVTDLWAPTITLTNEVKNSQVVEAGGRLVSVTSDGHIVWTVIVTTHTSCNLDMTYFPFDFQRCFLVFFMNQPVSEVRIREQFVKYSPNYKGNGEFESKEIYGSVAIRSLLGDLKQYTSVLVQLKIERRAPFYVVNIIMPIVVLSLLGNMVFVVSVESGEKLSFVLTVFLSQAVFLSFISTLMPKTSDELPYLTIYLGAILLLNALSVLASLFVMDVYHKGKLVTKRQPSDPFRVILKIFGPPPDTGKRQHTHCVKVEDKWSTLASCPVSRDDTHNGTHKLNEAISNSERLFKQSGLEKTEADTGKMSKMSVVNEDKQVDCGGSLPVYGDIGGKVTLALTEADHDELVLPEVTKRCPEDDLDLSDIWTRTSKACDRMLFIVFNTILILMSLTFFIHVR